MLYEEITARILKCCFDVSKELGIGFLEIVYECALVVALRQEGLKAENQVPISIRFRGHVVGEFRGDILVEDKILLELKAVKSFSA